MQVLTSKQQHGKMFRTTSGRSGERVRSAYALAQFDALTEPSVNSQ